MIVGAQFWRKGQSEESPHWVKEPILAGRAAATWLANRPVRHPDSEGKSLQKVDGLVEIPYIYEENTDEDPEIRVSVKDEGLIGKKMRETILAKGKTEWVGKGEVVCTEYDER